MGHTRSRRSESGEEIIGTWKLLGQALTSPPLNPEGGAEPRRPSQQDYRPHAHATASPLPQLTGLGTSS